MDSSPDVISVSFERSEIQELSVPLRQFCRNTGDVDHKIAHTPEAAKRSKQHSEHRKKGAADKLFWFLFSLKLRAAPQII
jgi:hypothetical protein